MKSCFSFLNVDIIHVPTLWNISVRIANNVSRSKITPCLARILYPKICFKNLRLVKWCDYNLPIFVEELHLIFPEVLWLADIQGVLSVLELNDGLVTVSDSHVVVDNKTWNLNKPVFTMRVCPTQSVALVSWTSQLWMLTL